MTNKITVQSYIQSTAVLKYMGTLHTQPPEKHQWKPYILMDGRYDLEVAVRSKQMKSQAAETHKQAKNLQLEVSQPVMPQPLPHGATKFY